MAHGEYCSKEFIGFGQKCDNIYSKFKDKNESNFVNTCQNFGRDLKNGLMAELNYKLVFDSNNVKRNKYEGRSLNDVVCKLSGSDYEKCLENFNTEKENFIKDINGYLDKVRTSFVESYAENASNTHLLLKGKFAMFYEGCIKYAKNLEKEENIEDIKKNLNLIDGVCSFYINESKKTITKKRLFFKKPVLVKLNGRALVIGTIKAAAKHLLECKI